MNNYFQQRIAKINLTLSEMVGGYYRMAAGMKKLGFEGSLKAIWDDLFALSQLRCLDLTYWFSECLSDYGWNSFMSTVSQTGQE